MNEQKTRAGDILNELHDSGELRSLVQSGLISVNVFNWRKIFNTYNTLKADGFSEMRAKEGAADTFGVSVRSVYRILNTMNYEPKEQPRKH